MKTSILLSVLSGIFLVGCSDSETPSTNRSPSREGVARLDNRNGDGTLSVGDEQTEAHQGLTTVIDENGKVTTQSVDSKTQDLNSDTMRNLMGLNANWKYLLTPVSEIPAKAELQVLSPIEFKSVNDMFYFVDVKQVPLKPASLTADLEPAMARLKELILLTGSDHAFSLRDEDVKLFYGRLGKPTCRISRDPFHTPENFKLDPKAERMPTLVRAVDQFGSGEKNLLKLSGALLTFSDPSTNIELELLCGYASLQSTHFQVMHLDQAMGSVFHLQLP